MVITIPTEESVVSVDDAMALSFPVDFWIDYFKVAPEADDKFTLSLAGWVFLVGVLPFEGRPAVWEFPNPQVLWPLERLLGTCDDPIKQGPFWLVDAAFRVVVSHRLDPVGVTLRSCENAASYLAAQANGPETPSVGEISGTVRVRTPTHGLVVLDDGGWFAVRSRKIDSSIIGSRVMVSCDSALSETTVVV